jgi:catechol 2,3-dioxygenase-like lactoylglutathione lyase family enzyme
MIGYVLLGTNNLAAARRFYDPLIAEIGGKILADQPNRVFYGTDLTQPMLGVTLPFDGSAATVGNGTMVALPVASRDEVDRIHAKALELGATDEGAPACRFDPEFGLYFAYARDPDGNKLAFFKIGPA